MNEEQLHAAREAMENWLSHPQELGRLPAKIECTGDFQLHGLRYYMFRYKKSVLSRWMLGVAGGYEENSSENCGHVFSEMEPYDEAIAQDRCIAMVERIRAYWKARADQAQQETELQPPKEDRPASPSRTQSHREPVQPPKAGPAPAAPEPPKEAPKQKEQVMLGLVLLSRPQWDREKLLADLKRDWDMVLPCEESDRVDLLCFSGTSKVFISLVPAPVSGSEAELNAENNYMWRGSVDAANAHKAHLTVAVLDREQDPIHFGQLFVKVMASCCRQENALGVYTGSTVVAPDAYLELAQSMKKEQLPVLNWIWFQLYRSERGLCCYTDGMRRFGKDEMEILDADGKPAEIRGLLIRFASYALEHDVELRHGDTIGFSKDDRHTITRSEGVGQTGMTLKISYQAR